MLQQFRADEPAARKLVLRRGHVVDMRAFERRPTGLLRARARAHGEIDIGLVRQALVESRIRWQVEADYVLAFRGHRRLLVTMPLRGRPGAARGQWKSGHYTDACRGCRNSALYGSPYLPCGLDHQPDFCRLRSEE